MTTRYFPLKNALSRTSTASKRLGIDTEVPNVYAVYALKHNPTARIYFGSTLYLRTKLCWWYNAIAAPATSACLPEKMRNVLADHGHFPDAWSYAIVDTQKPAEYNPRAKDIHRPEWPLIERLTQTGNAHLVLNRTWFGKEYKVVGYSGRRGGMAPSTYLAIKLGLRKGPLYSEMPPHNFKRDPTSLVPMSAPNVPFALYLHRSLAGMYIRNPSPEAIAELYAKWLAGVPGSEREAVGNEVPYTIDAALNVVTPRGYDLT